MQTIEIPPIKLDWSNWESWNSLKETYKKFGKFVAEEEVNGLKVGHFEPIGIGVPSKSGVYEVRLKGSNDNRLTIGESVSLKIRIKNALIKGSLDHSSGVKIKAHEDLENIEVRWAETEWPCAAEEYLHKTYKKKFGQLPKYTKRT